MLKTLAEKPYIAKYVKNYIGTALEIPSPEDHTSAMDMSLLTRVESSWIRETCLKSNLYNHDDYKKWEEDIFRPDNWDACTSLLLLVFSKNLKSIVMSNYDINNEILHQIGMALNHMARLQEYGEKSKSMSKLREVSVKYYDTEGGMIFEYVLPYLALKLILNFTARVVAEEE